MKQLLRREFLLRVLMTMGVISLTKITGFTEDKIFNMSAGLSEILDSEIESIYNALTVVI